MILKMAITSILNKNLVLCLGLFLTLSHLLASPFQGSSSFGEHVYLFKNNKLFKLHLQTKQMVNENAIKKDSGCINALMRAEQIMNKPNQNVMIQNINAFEILSLGNKKDSLYVAIRFKNPKNRNSYSFYLLRFDENLRFHKPYQIKYPPIVNYNYFPKFKELGFNNNGELQLIYCDSSKQICQINFSFIENKNILKSDPKSRILIQTYTKMKFYSDDLEMFSPNIYAIKGSSMFLMQPYPVLFNANGTQFIDPFGLKQQIITQDGQSITFNQFLSLNQNTLDVNYTVLHVEQDSANLNIYVKNHKEGVLQKLSSKQGTSPFVIETITPLNFNLRYLIFYNKGQAYLLSEIEQIELIPIK